MSIACLKCFHDKIRDPQCYLSMSIVRNIQAGLKAGKPLNELFKNQSCSYCKVDTAHTLWLEKTFNVRREDIDAFFVDVQEASKTRMDNTCALLGIKPKVIKDKKKLNALFVKACKGGQFDLAKEFVADGANVTHQDGLAFALAMRNGHAKIADWLTSIGGRCDKPTSHGGAQRFYPLQHALIGKHFELAQKYFDGASQFELCVAALHALHSLQQKKNKKIFADLIGRVDPNEWKRFLRYNSYTCGISDNDHTYVIRGITLSCYHAVMAVNSALFDGNMWPAYITDCGDVISRQWYNTIHELSVNYVDAKIDPFDVTVNSVKKHTYLHNKNEYPELGNPLYCEAIKAIITDGRYVIGWTYDQSICFEVGDVHWSDNHVATFTVNNKVHTLDICVLTSNFNGKLMLCDNSAYLRKLEDVPSEMMIVPKQIYEEFIQNIEKNFVGSQRRLYEADSSPTCTILKVNSISQTQFDVTCIDNATNDIYKNVIIDFTKDMFTNSIE